MRNQRRELGLGVEVGVSDPFHSRVPWRVHTDQNLYTRDSLGYCVLSCIPPSRTHGPPRSSPRVRPEVGQSPTPPSPWSVGHLIGMEPEEPIHPAPLCVSSVPHRAPLLSAPPGYCRGQGADGLGADPSIKCISYCPPSGNHHLYM